jgi:hypothetical protein
MEIKAERRRFWGIIWESESRKGLYSAEKDLRGLIT